MIAKVSVPANHSAAVLKLAEMPYCGSTSFFLKVFINKRYALPRRVIDALLAHFCQFERESRDLPVSLNTRVCKLNVSVTNNILLCLQVVWHQSLLAFVQRYKFELTQDQKEQMKTLLKVHSHHQITGEVRRELFSVAPPSAGQKLS